MNSPINLWRLQKENRKLLGKTGKVISFTTIHVAPFGFESQAPYVLAIAKLETGSNITTQVVNPKNIKIGTKVKVIIRRLATPKKDEIIDYGPKLEIIT